MRQKLPWWAKLGAKVAIAQFPISMDNLFKARIFRHGDMQNTDYAKGVFYRHYEAVKAKLPVGFVTLELGPGDSLYSAILAAKEQSSQTYLVDAGAFATMDIQLYNRFGQQFETVSEMLQVTNATYLTDGLKSLQQIPPNTVDFIFSNAVLEHVQRREFETIIQALYHAQTFGGVSSHQIDLRDHLARSLNSLRFSPQVWESRFFSHPNIYTNRLRASEIVEIFQRVGYRVIQNTPYQWDTLPLAKAKLHTAFHQFSDDDLRTHSLWLVVEKPLEAA